MKPTVIANFTGNEILGEKGRILFALLNAFSQANFSIRFIYDNQKDSLGLHGDKIFQLHNLSVINRIPDDTEYCIFLYDHADNAILKKNWLKTVRVRFDIFSCFRINQPILFPYPVHPVHSGAEILSKLDDLRGAVKKVRLFFSGDMKGYTKSLIKYPNIKLSRLEAINTIINSLPDQTLFLKDSNSVETLLSGSYKKNCMIIDTGQTWIDDRYWLDTLSKSDFFLALPGIVMPMCHNIIEAMSVGTIPVTNYPEWFHPNLEHLKNCIVFSDKSDLIDKINLVLSLDTVQIQEMRQNVIQYYKEFLTPNGFIDKINKMDNNHIDILMITERYVANNANRLNRNSFIIKGAVGKLDFLLQKLIRIFRL